MAEIDISILSKSDGKFVDHPVSLVEFKMSFSNWILNKLAHSPNKK